MKFWVTTPSFNQVEWLRLCVASVADQATEGMAHGAERIEVHHHIQDACSTDGTREFLAEHLANSQQLSAKGYTFSYESVKDEGMYDAINKGWEKSCGKCDVLSYLNCDEQYLEHALESVADAFIKNPSGDVVFTNLLILDAQGDYICHRRGLKPVKWSVRFVGPCPTAATFLKPEVFFRKGCRFKSEWKVAGDLVWYNDLTHQNLEFVLCNGATSIYTALETNLSNSDRYKAESLRYEEVFLGKFKRLKTVAERINLVRRMMKDLYIPVARSYAIYRPGCSGRIAFKINNASSIWGRS